MVQENDLRRQLLQIAHDVGCDDDSALCRDGSNQLAEVDALLRIQPYRGFIHDDELRIPENGLGKQRALTHAAGVGPDGVILRFPQVDCLDGFLYLSRSSRFVNPLQSRDVKQKAQQREAVVKLLLLRHISDMFAIVFSHGADLTAVKRQFPRRCLKVRRHDSHEGTLPRTVWPEKAVDAGMERIGEVDQCLLFPVVLCQFFRFQNHSLYTPNRLRYSRNITRTKAK